VERAKPDAPRAVAAVLAAAALCAALTGCAVGPEYVQPSTQRTESWSAKEGAGVTSQAADSAWWKSFNDPTLDSLVLLAFRQNLPLQLAALRIMEARAQLGVATGRQFPQIQAIFAHANAIGLSEHAANVAGFDREFWDFQVGFDAVWELDFWGRLRQDVRAETGIYLATEADYDNALVSLLAEVARTYTVVRTFEALLDQARTNIVLQEEGLRIAESRFRNGVTSELDVTQSTTLLEGTRATVPQLQVGLLQAQNALCTLLGRPTGSLTSLLAASRGIPVAPAQAAIGVPAEVLRRRPDVRSAELNAVAQCARIGVAKSELYPRLAIFGTIGTQNTSGAGTQASSGYLFGPGSLFYAIGPRLYWPLFDYGRTKNRVRIEDARYQQSIVSYQNAVLKAAQEVEDGLTGYLRSQEAAVFSQNAARAAARSAELAFIQYREGAVDFQRVLDAQRSLLEEENSVVRTRSSIATNLIAVYKALGGGWELRRGQPVLPESTQVEMSRRTNWGNYLAKPPTTQSEQTLSQPR
jgi:NodT family efflux transporter outer membrane factor (OMF) lipoprotein